MQSEGEKEQSACTHVATCITQSSLEVKRSHAVMTGDSDEMLENVILQ